MRPISHLIAVTLTLFPLQAWCAPPMADVHVHFKWSQEDVTTTQQAVEVLISNNIALAVVIGTPAEYALQLEQLAPDRIVPIWSPYRSPGDWSVWAHDKGVVERARQAMETGKYRGIGELHLIGGVAPDWRSPVIAGLAQIAVEFSVPLLLHTEYSRPDYMLGLCGAYPNVRLLWAHAGSILTPEQVSGVMTHCPNVWVELSARDPWRFVNNPITNRNITLLPEWRELLEAFPERFMVGSDPVWPVENLDSWDKPDTGWEQYGRFIGFHREWIDKLSPGLAQKLRLDNALKFFATGPDNK